ncbi:MAG: DNA repair protein RecN [Acidobacteria bacterium]|nr:DNA repair protein RecN [Acidobacteriota bacterium]
MLRFLRIQHLAVIDRLELDLEPGLTVLTGETGAGKSILVGAVGLLVGGRASADLVRTGEEHAVIEAIFETHERREIILRREVSAQGRSRAFIDGALATSAALRETCEGLVDLHGQHEHQRLLDPSSHLALLDEFGDTADLRISTASAFGSWQKVREERDRLLTGEREKAARADFIRFQLAEIDRVAPQPGEDDDLAATRLVLANADKLQRLCGDAYTALYEGDDAALPALGVVWRKVADLASLDPRFNPYLEARDAVKSQLEDLAYFLRSYAADIDASPARLQEIEDRLAALERLKKKHGPTLAGVLDTAERLRGDLDEIEHATERAMALEETLEAARNGFVATAVTLSKARRETAPQFASKLERALADLAMTRTRCEVRLTDPADETMWSDRGLENGEFFISPNPGEDLRPLARIVSGGELSRIMLALKTLASTDAPGKTLIFDEVDAGIGGAVADVVGRRLQALSDRYQVLCITHLPQIAAYGASHFRIAKTVRNDRTMTDVTRLAGPEREVEMARMIGGADVSATVLASAREMLDSRSPVTRRKRK